MDHDRDELARCLRTWRDRLSPAEVGLPAGGRRRAPGLRREELAGLAGVSLDYLARLEQGRATHPSASVVASLARALRLTDAERDHLQRLAGHAPEGPGTIDRHLTPGVQRIVDRLADQPVLVMDAAWQVVAANPLAVALLGDWSGLPERERNVAWRHFGRFPICQVRTPEEDDRMAREIVADLHQVTARYPHDEPLRQLVADLRATCQRFAELWEARPVMPRHASRKTFDHPQVGLMTLDCDVLQTTNSDLRLVVYSAAPGSDDARALALLATIGLQDMGAQAPAPA
ncbi:helix-turn-helix transcriptional regulator [Conexibacter sp. SYSU D00693]|uniref:helix-turn-helix transcriptional regulator n=1 Tax=Conexibacter sp. SYSU D00693 TaxID=2812560 RepID=UPI00196A70D5|nr:helix-turn-helix transcriptional regulator [Conexibacter sp. SYSU D00693]